MKIAIFSDAPRNYSPRRLQAEAKQRGLRSDLINYLDVDFYFGNGKIEAAIGDQKQPRYEGVIFRSLRLDMFPQRELLIDYFSHGVILNKASLQTWPRLERDKFTQHRVLVGAGLPVAESRVFGRQNKVGAQIKKGQVVVKAFRGSHGRNVFKAETAGEMAELLAKYHPYELLVQEVLAEGEDVRVIVIGGEAVGAMKRFARPGNFVSNYSAGGRVENLKLAKAAAVGSLAVKAAAAFKLEFGGIDLMRDNEGKWRVLEVNRACQFKGFEEATGVNVAGQLVNYLQQKMDKSK